MASYIPHTEQDTKEMLGVLGIESLSDLFKDIPESIRCESIKNVDNGKPEETILAYMKQLATMNTKAVSFMGCGIYDHIIPAAVSHLSSLPAFKTAYTPYQPEISQGLLQAIFEYQTMICELTNLPVSNASLYDGSTAAAEAVSIAFQSKRKAKTFLISPTVHPSTIEVIKTHFSGLEVSFKILKESYDHSCDLSNLSEFINEDVAGLLVQSPNIYGILEDYSGVSELLHKEKALFVISANPMSFGLVKSPGEWGADIAVGDTQPFGIPQNFGGPSVGYLAAEKSLLRKVPGRIVGQTVDKDGKRAFVLTLQAREQHIKRERATSNICSNQALAALTTAIYISEVGWKGIKEAAHQSYQKAHYLFSKIQEIIPEACTFSESLFWNEFTLDFKTTEKAEKFLKYMKHMGIFAGVPLSSLYLDSQSDCKKGLVVVAVTEKRTKEEISTYLQAVKEFVYE